MPLKLHKQPEEWVFDGVSNFLSAPRSQEIMRGLLVKFPILQVACVYLKNGEFDNLKNGGFGFFIIERSKRKKKKKGENGWRFLGSSI